MGWDLDPIAKQERVFASFLQKGSASLIAFLEYQSPRDAAEVQPRFGPKA